MSHPPAIFVGDAPGLDFLNSIATPVDTPIDWIDDGEGLLNWLEQAELVPTDVLEEYAGAGVHRRARQGRRIRRGSCGNGFVASCASIRGVR